VGDHFAIFTFPFGLVALVPVFNMDGQIGSFIESTKDGQKNKSASSKADNNMDSKIEKINKLHEMKEQGIIDEEKGAVG
jgi:hypothetical protein